MAAAPLARPATAQGPLTIGIDADTRGNEPDSLGSIEPCVSVATDDTFDIDIFVQDVDELLAWEMYVEYDPAVLEITGRDVHMFLAANEGSVVLDVSASLPNRDGLYRAAAADTSDPPTPDSGSGVLLRLTLRAIQAGTSEVNLAVLDINDDEVVDLGPLLRDVDSRILGDSDDNGIFDGAIENAEIVVDEESDCPGLSPELAPDGNSTNWTLVAIASAAGALGVAIAAVAVRRLLKRRRSLQ